MKNKIKVLLVVAVLILGSLSSIHAETYEIGLYAEEQQEILGWGGFPSYARTDWGAAFAPPVHRPGVFKALFGDSGLSIFRVDYQPRFYNSVADDGSINTKAVDDLITMVKGAGEFGITDYLVSIWSPPAVMKNTRTINGRDDEGNISSLLKYREKDYIDYICTVTDYIRSQGVPTPKFISIGNEPTYAVWYDSNVYSAEQYQRLCVMLREELDARGHTTVNIVAGEGNNYHYNYDIFGYNYDDFFLNQEFQDSVHTFAAHSYDSGNYSMVDINQMRDLIRRIDRPFMQSEWCPEGPNFSSYNDVPLAVAIHTARHFAREMGDVGFNYWFWWMMWTESRGNMGLLGGNSPIDEGDNYKILSTIWKNAPPGSKAKKLYTTDPELISTGASEIDMVGFSNEENNKTTILIVNPTENNKDITLKYIPGKNIAIHQLVSGSVFGEIDRRALNEGEAQVNFPGRSITVIVSDGASLEKSAPQPPPLPPLEPLKEVEYFVSQSILTVEAERIDSINIDGMLDEEKWNLSKSLDKLITGTTDNTAVFGVLYDDKYLYVGADVKDNAVCDSESTAGHLKDSVEIYIDAGNEKATAYDNNDFQLMATIVQNKVVGGGGAGDSCVMASNITDEGYTVEVAIPWAVLNANPLTSGGVFGFDVAVNDNDNGVNRSGQIMWSGRNTNWMNTENFGECILTGIKTEDASSLFRPIFDGGLKDAKQQLTRTTISNGEPRNGSGSMEITFKGPATAMFRFGNPFNVTPSLRDQLALKFQMKAQEDCKMSIVMTSESDVTVTISYVIDAKAGEWIPVTIPMNMFEDLGRNPTGLLQKFSYGNITGVGFEATDSVVTISDLKIDTLYDSSLPMVNNLIATEKTESSISLKWDAVEGAEGYRLYRNGIEIGDFPLQVTQFRDQGLLGGRPYAYHIVSHNGGERESRSSGHLIEITVPSDGVGGAALITADFSRFYDDVASFKWAIHYIDTLTESNLLKGEFQYNGYMFKPEQAISGKDFAYVLEGVLGAKTVLGQKDWITREEAFSEIAKALELEAGDIAVLGGYSDLSEVDDQMVGAFAAMIEAGLVRGNGEKLLPKEPITRAEVAVVLGKL